MFNEAKVTVNGIELNGAHAMTIRVALDSFRSRMLAEGLGDDEHGRFMATSYVARAAEVLELMMRASA